jgi:MoxR-like ATPase
MTELTGQLERIRLLLHRRARWLQNGFAAAARAEDPLAGTRPEDERRYYETDPVASALGKAAAERPGASSTLEVLVALFGLGDFERDVLLLCLAAELDPAFEALFAHVQDDAGRTYPTPGLAVTLLADGDERFLAAFLEGSPLRQAELIELEPAPHAGAPLAARPLRLPERIVGFLLGVNRIDEAVAPYLRPLPVPALAAEQDALAERLAAEVAAAGEESGPLQLVGPPGSGRAAVASALCARVGLRAVALEAELLPERAHARRGVLRVLEREAVLLRLAYVVDADRTAVGEDMAAAFGPALIVATAGPPPLRRAWLTARVPAANAAGQRALWRQALGKRAAELDGALDATVATFDFGPDAIADVAAAAEHRALLEGSGAGALARAIRDGCRERAGQPLAGLADRIEPTATWDDLVAPDDVVRSLREVADQVAHRTRVYDDWGFGPRLARGRGITALFSGQSGTGKTLAAEIVAAHLDLELYRVDLAGVVSKYIGETEKNLRSVFDAAERCGAVLFFDEADALFGRRTEVRDSHDRYANIEVDYLLQRMEAYRGLAILATNRRQALDRAFLRRLRFLVEFPFPDAAGRERIWRLAFPPVAQLADVDFEVLAQLELAGGNIATIAVNAAFLAAAERQPIGMEHVSRAARSEYAKLARGTDDLPLEVVA